MPRAQGGSATATSITLSGTSDVNIKQVGGTNFALGQQLAAVSLPVVLTASQLSTLTPPAAITNYALESGGNLATIAGIVSSSRAAVNLISGQVGVAGGSGIVGATTQRVVLATDVALPTGSNVIGHVITDSGSVVNATLGAETTKVIGTINIAAFQTVGLVAGTAVIGHVIVDSGTITTVSTVSNISQIASVTPSFGDVNNATGETGALNIAPIGRYNATQPTLTDTRYNQLQVSSRGELLVVPGVSNFAVQAAQSGNWTSRIVGNGGATIDAVVGAGTAPTNMLAVGGLYNSTEISPTTGQSAALQLDSKGRLRTVLMDGAGNTRSANVVNGTYGNMLLSIRPHDTGGFSDTYSNSPTNYVDENYNQIMQGVFPFVFNGTTWDRAPGTTKGRYEIIRDAAGNARGANVNASNQLSVSVDNTPSVNATLSAETTKVIGTVNQGTSPWVVAGGLTNNNAAPSTNNLGALVAIANAAQQSWTEGREVLLSTNLKGSLRSIIQDAAGNDRGANIDASNNLMVNINAGISHAAPSAAPPSNIDYIGGKDGFSNIVHPYQTQDGQGDGNSGSGFFPTSNWVYTGSSWDRMPGDKTNGAYVQIKNGLMPSGTALNTYSAHITTNTTNTPTSSTAYISSIAISSEVAGTTSTVTIQDKQGTPLKLVNGFSTTSLTTTPTVVNFQTPIKMVSGIDVITSGAVAATVDVWINYFQ